MKKIITFSIALIAAATAANAQIFTVTSIEKAGNPVAEQSCDVAAISPQGDYLLLTSSTKQGLVKFDLATRQATVLTTAAGAGFGALITADGKNVVFRDKITNDDHLVLTGVKQVDVATRATATLLEPTRDLQAVAVEGSTAITVDRTSMKTRALRGTATATRPVVLNDGLQLLINEGGHSRSFAPNGPFVSYIWESLSPDGKRVLYYAGGLGCFVCNIDGTGLQELGLLRAPQWYDDNTVVGMRDVDDGKVLLSSVIIAKTLDGREQTLTGDDVIATYPQVSPRSGKIAFSTPTGEAFIINITQ